jgi:signal transduction histidine kinase
LLGRALGNLADNAVRHGDGTITLTATRLGDPPGVVVLAVHDDGAGIAADFLPHAAERFRQSQESRTGAGHGLGLALVDAIATAHHGQLRVCSRGSHHRQPTPDPRIDTVACCHPAAGTTVGLLLPAVSGQGPGDRPH